jgi:hypothetical protein
MLEADLDIDTRVRQRTESDGPPLSPSLRRQDSPKFITYYDFLGSYWGHFPQALTKGLGGCTMLSLVDVLIILQIPRWSGAKFWASSKAPRRLSNTTRVIWTKQAIAVSVIVQIPRSLHNEMLFGACSPRT